MSRGRVIAIAFLSIAAVTLVACGGGGDGGGRTSGGGTSTSTSTSSVPADREQSTPQQRTTEQAGDPQISARQRNCIVAKLNEIPADEIIERADELAAQFAEQCGIGDS